MWLKLICTMYYKKAAIKSENHSFCKVLDHTFQCKKYRSMENCQSVWCTWFMACYIMSMHTSSFSPLFYTETWSVRTVIQIPHIPATYHMASIRLTWRGQLHTLVASSSTQTNRAINILVNIGQYWSTGNFYLSTNRRESARVCLFFCSLIMLHDWVTTVW